MLLPPGPCLNYDLVELILNSNDHWWPCDLVNLSLLSAVWTEPVRRRLYFTPRLTTFLACSRLSRTLAENPTLLSYMKGVELCPIAGEKDSPGGMAHANIRPILGCYGLKFITIGGELANYANRFLFAISDPDSVEELHIDGRALESSSIHGQFASLEWDESFSFRFSNLKKLRLSSLELTILRSSDDIPNTLISELTLDDVTTPLGLLSDVFDQDSPLRKLSMRTQCHTDMATIIQDAISHCMLDQLEYEVFAGSASDFTLFDASQPGLAFLRSIRLSGVNVHWDTLQVIRQRCQALEELVVMGRGVSISTDEWASFITSSSPSSLRRLGLPRGTKHPPFCGWSSSVIEEFRKLASRHNIRLLE